MKTIRNTFLALAAAMSLGASAQTAEVVDNPNRILMYDNAGSFTGYVVDRVGSLQFARVDGPCTAAVTIFGFNKDTKTLSLKVMRQEGCEGFRIGVLPKVVSDQLATDEQAISYLMGSGMASEIYWQDFEQADLSGMELTSGSEYTVITIGIDRYNVNAGVARADFSVEAAPVTGEPAVEMTVDQVTLDSFTCSFDPNEDCYEYYYVAGEKGTLQSQYEMFAPMMGFSCMGDMIKAWGVSTSGPSTFTWKNMAPNTTYDVLVQPLDEQGNMAPYQTFEVSTLAKGGQGEAHTDVEFGDYRLTDWNGEQKPSQFITYKPNQETWRYHFNVQLASDYDKDPEAYQQDVMTLPPMEMANFWFFEDFTTDYQINPNVEFVVLVASQNADGQWGPLTIVRHTTPGQTANLPAKVTPRLQVRPAANQQGKVRTSGKLMLR